MRTAIDNLQLAEATAIGDAVFTSLTAITNFQSTAGRRRGRAAGPDRAAVRRLQHGRAGRRRRRSTPRTPRKVPVSTIAFGTDYGTLDLNGETVAGAGRPARRWSRSPTTPAAATARRPARRSWSRSTQDLGSQIGYTTEPQDISPWFVRGGLLFAFLGVVASLLWTNRLL